MPLAHPADAKVLDCLRLIRFLCLSGAGDRKRADIGFPGDEAESQQSQFEEKVPKGVPKSRLLVILLLFVIPGDYNAGMRCLYGD